MPQLRSEISKRGILKALLSVERLVMLMIMIVVFHFLLLIFLIFV
jgi:hypothetical protein